MEIKKPLVRFTASTLLAFFLAGCLASTPKPEVPPAETQAPFMMCAIPSDQGPMVFGLMFFKGSGSPESIRMETIQVTNVSVAAVGPNGMLQPYDDRVFTGLDGVYIPIGKTSGGAIVQIDLGSCLVKEDLQPQLKQYFKNFTPPPPPGFQGRINPISKRDPFAGTRKTPQNFGTTSRQAPFRGIRGRG